MGGAFLLGFMFGVALIIGIIVAAIAFLVKYKKERSFKNLFISIGFLVFGVLLSYMMFSTDNIFQAFLAALLYGVGFFIYVFLPIFIVVKIIQWIRKHDKRI